jgi:SHS2 domain-containing protein
MPYEIIDGITRADIAFRISGKYLNELFFSGAEALVFVMIENPDSISNKTERKFMFQNSSLDLLLYDFLNELIFVKDAESLILKPQNISISNLDNIYQLDGVFCGENIDCKKHKLKVDVKAVTMHNFRTDKTQSGWEAVFILDL